MHTLKRFLKTSGLSSNFRYKAALAFTLSALLSAGGCGKRKPPLPPIERVSQRVQISGFQRGGQIVLSWRMPARNAADGSVTEIERADIYRLIEPLSAPQQISEDEFASRSNLISSVPFNRSDFALKEFAYTDELQFAAQPARIRYAVRLVNQSGQKAAFSNFLLLEPSAAVAEAPSNLAARATQDAIILRWTPPFRSIDRTTPVNVLGYNVYRADDSSGPARLLTKNPVSGTEYNDALFDFDKKYTYFVRAVSLSGTGAPIESRESNIVEFTPLDTFPPAAPEAVTVAAAPGNISLFFAVNLEKDIAGYNVYRSENPDADKSSWRKLNADLLPVNNYQDKSVESGKKYFYYLTAVDNKGNVSQPSLTVSETAP